MIDEVPVVLDAHKCDEDHRRTELEKAQCFVNEIRATMMAQIELVCGNGRERAAHLRLPSLTGGQHAVTLH
jgi:hypothetical protein